MRQVEQEMECRKAKELVMRAQKRQRTNRIRPCPRKRRPVVRWQRLGQHEESVRGVGKTEASGEPERRSRSESAQHAAERRSDDEADPERGAQKAIGPRTLFR